MCLMSISKSTFSCSKSTFSCNQCRFLTGLAQALNHVNANGTSTFSRGTSTFSCVKCRFLLCVPRLPARVPSLASSTGSLPATDNTISVIARVPSLALSAGSLPRALRLVPRVEQECFLLNLVQDPGAGAD